MTAYATTSDLRSMPGCSDVDEVSASTLISLVSAAMDAICDAGEVPEDVLRLVCCQAASRMLHASDGGPGIQSESWGASPYTGSVTYANPAGDIYFTAFEKRLLGADEPWCGYVNQEVPDA